MRSDIHNPVRQPSKMWQLIIFAGLLFINIQNTDAHPMPHTVLLMDIKSSKVDLELQLPLNELELAFGYNVNNNPGNLVRRLGPQLRAYIAQHTRPVAPDGKPWSVVVNDMQVQFVKDSPSGPYRQLTAHVSIVPPAGESTRQFSLHYDVIMHQVVSHFALVSVRQDWDNGLSADHPYQVGVIHLDVKNNVLPPLEINLQEGNLWKGFYNMVSLGIEHIKEGTDHLLFLLTLLLPAPLIVISNRWAKAGGTRYSLIRILKIVTAFTIGHSITLLLGASGWIHFPGRPIEVLIAVSILISAIHALRPIFPGKEMYIAAGFGLIHGMAFAQTLVNLNLDTGRMALSILGFNIGIELMQLFVIAITIPWLIILSRTKAYKPVRITGAILAGIAALTWIIERISQEANYISDFVTAAANYAQWIILLLAVMAIFSLLVKKRASLGYQK